MTDAEPAVRFVPSRVEGMDDVREVVVRPHQLEVLTAEGRIVFPFKDIGRPQEYRWKSVIQRILGFQPYPVMVGQRDWFHAPPDRFFEWYTDRPLRTCMPESESEGKGYNDSLFPQIHEVLAAGGYATYDLG